MRTRLWKASDDPRTTIRWAGAPSKRDWLRVGISHNLSTLGNGQGDVVVLFISAEPSNVIHNGSYDALRG